MFAIFYKSTAIRDLGKVFPSNARNFQCLVCARSESVCAVGNFWENGQVLTNVAPVCHVTDLRTRREIHHEKLRRCSREGRHLGAIRAFQTMCEIKKKQKKKERDKKATLTEIKINGSDSRLLKRREIIFDL